MSILGKKLKATLFGEEIELNFGMRFSVRLREICPDYHKVLEDNNVERIMILSVMAALPQEFYSKTESEVIDEIDNLEDPTILGKCMDGFTTAMNFFAQALNGAVKMAEAVEKGKIKPKK